MKLVLFVFQFYYLNQLQGISINVIKKMNYLGSFATFAAYRTLVRDDAAVEYPLFHSFYSLFLFILFMAQNYFSIQLFRQFFIIIQLFVIHRNSSSDLKK